MNRKHSRFYRAACECWRICLGQPGDAMCLACAGAVIALRRGATIVCRDEDELREQVAKSGGLRWATS